MDSQIIGVIWMASILYIIMQCSNTLVAQVVGNVSITTNFAILLRYVLYYARMCCTKAKGKKG